MKSGIYTITNTLDGKIYVGYSKDIKNRLRDHKTFLLLGKHKNTHLQNAWNLYKEENFLFEELEKCSIEFIVALEHYWATLLNVHNREFGYNMKPTHPYDISVSHSKETCAKISTSSKGKKLSQETKDKIGKANKANIVSQERREATSKRLLGIPRSKEVIEKIAKANKSKTRSEECKKRMSEIGKNRVFTEETKEKLRIAKIGFKITWGDKISEVNFKNPKIKRVKVNQFTLDMNLVQNWDSLLKVERNLGINNANLHKCCLENNKREYKFLTLKGFIWKFFEG